MEKVIKATIDPSPKKLELERVQSKEQSIQSGPTMNKTTSSGQECESSMPGSDKILLQASISIDDEQ